MTKAQMKKHVKNLSKKIAKITGAKRVDGRINDDDEQVILEFRAKVSPSEEMEDKITEAVEAEIPDGMEDCRVDTDDDEQVVVMVMLEVEEEGCED